MSASVNPWRGQSWARGLMREAGFPDSMFNSPLESHMRYSPLSELYMYIERMAKILRPGNEYERLLTLLIRERLNGTQ